MNQRGGNRPAEVFGYSIENRSTEAEVVRKRHWCPFVNEICKKKSRLIDYPFGVCSVEYRGGVCLICPQRFEEPGAVGVPKVLEDVALHYFGGFENTVAFSEVGLRNVGSIDYVLVRHKPMRPEVEDFVLAEFQSDSTTGTGGVVQGVRDAHQGLNLAERSYRFGMNTYDTIKRAMTQLMNKGIVYETWGVKCYWVLQQYIYSNLVNRYGFKESGFASEHASRFALYDMLRWQDRLILVPGRVVSTTVDQVYQAMRTNPGLPDKDSFVERLNSRLRARLSVHFE